MSGQNAGVSGPVTSSGPKAREKSLRKKQAVLENEEIPAQRITILDLATQRLLPPILGGSK